MSFIDRGGVRIFYEVTGSGDGPPVLLSHGFGSSSLMWSPNVGALAAGRPVVTWDMRGHGRSDSPADQADYSAAACVADMVALLDVAGADRAVLCGLSLGGYLSLAFRLVHPERVAALILCDTGPGYRNDQARQEWNDRALAQADRLEHDGLTALGPDSSHHSSAGGVARAARGMLTQWDASVIESLPDIAVPTLVLVGSRDKPFIGAANYMTSKIPGAEQVVIDDAGHVANVDAPAAFNDAVLAFLAQLQPQL
ncbi:MAG TPA: alpha/beta fold hydrolase [Streptosporangiaceae bacterium]|jgi:pimeloyl-ACP methyl ester carboxylesterase|nr:alpha/beta fold hydrolase [Streptosporangiaceae bacterium]